MPDVVQFTQEAIDQLRRDHLRLRNQLQNLQRMLAPRSVGGNLEEMFLVEASGPIQGRDDSGATPVLSAGDATVYRITVDGGAVIVEPRPGGLGGQQPLLNLGTAALLPGEILPAWRHTQGGWYATASLVYAYHAITPVGGIPGSESNGLVPGTGTVKLMEYDPGVGPSGSFVELGPAVEIDILNIGGPIAGSTVIVILRDAFGRWTAAVEACG